LGSQPKDEPGSLPGICNAAFGIGGSLGFTWAGTIVGEGTNGYWGGGVRDQPDPQASNGVVGLSHDHYYWLRGDVTCDVTTD
jgi:hypothetical protein